MFKILFSGLQKHTDLRDLLVKASKIEQFREIALEMKERRKDVSIEDKFGWYVRHWNRLSCTK